MSGQEGHAATVAARVRQLAGSDGSLAAAVAQGLWGRLPEEDLRGRDVEADTGASLASWQALRQREPGAVHVAVFNAEHGRDGWHSPHTLVRVLLDDAPFVVDSSLMALAQAGVATHLIGNVVFSVSRNDEGVLTACEPSTSGEAREVFFYAEIDRIPDASCAELAAALSDSLADVQAAVGDFAAMRAKAEAWKQQLAAAGDEASQESAAFVGWLLDNHFTFLGYREFRYADDVISQVPDSALGVLRRRNASTRRRLSEQPEAVRQFLLEPVALSFSKSGTLSRVHRPAYPDYVGLRTLDEDGRVVGEHGFLGLYTSRVYLEHPSTIPIVRRKVAEVIAGSRLDPGGFDGKVLGQVLATYPRDELLQIDTPQLAAHALDITYIHERRRTRAFFRFDRYGLFATCLVYLPRDLYNTDVRQRIQALLVDAFTAEHAEFQPYFSESILVRLHFTLRLRAGAAVAVDVQDIEQRIIALTRDWNAELTGQLVAQHGEGAGLPLVRDFDRAFPAGYQEHYSPRTAVEDIAQIQRLRAGEGLVSRLFRVPEDSPEWLRLKIFHGNVPLPLSDVIPALENMGLRVLGETPHIITAATGERFSVQDFQLRCAEPLDLNHVAPLFEQTFKEVWHDRADNDRFNELTLAPGLSWRQIEVLRAYARYNKQLRSGFSIEYMAQVLVTHPQAAAALIEAFEARFGEQGGDEDRPMEALEHYLDGVAVLNEDRILRRFLEALRATVRTNYFVAGRSALALKLTPRSISNVPRPVPAFEIFVCSATMEGVHLRGGAIARGGLRWSDRIEDYRTEVLGLVKAQHVKNAVIVPVGAKGGFVVKRSLTGDFRKDGVNAYKTFIGSLLSVTDNLQGGAVVRPAGVRARDEDDPYLVVAADKGTATFSDTANALAEERGFWLGDAFASGGSNGYDHKKMGITARGAWVSVQRHFAERGQDVQRDPITVLGIGDMGGDVFGNGLLLSESVLLVAAFNHRHIFLDPNPDAASSYAERQRLFDAVQGWDAYQTDLISAGGGVYDRAAKRIELSSAVRQRFQIEAASLSPDELIHELLKAPLGLIWNGGIGTYVKAGVESHDEVGDRANDGLRVDAHDLRCEVFGEGGNLGLTQAARIAFARNGGGVNTDFIDNSAGVDCSDHEVNIKILLGELVAAGDMTTKQRNGLLEGMTEDVAGLVLANNASQVLCLSLAQRHAAARHDEYRRLLFRFERELGLDRALEELPSDEVLLERFNAGDELTRPELAVLLAYAKMAIKQQLSGTSLLSDPKVSFLLRSAFPAEIIQRYPDAISRHRLAPEILATQIANDLVHHVGISFIMQMSELVGGTVEEIVRAYLIAAETMNLRRQWADIVALSVAEDVRMDMLLELVKLTRRAARWFLRHRRAALTVAEVADDIAPAVAELASQRALFMGTASGAAWTADRDRLCAAGVPEAVAERAANAGEFGAVLPVVSAAQEHGLDVTELAHRFTELEDQLHFGWLTATLSELPTRSHWQAMERDSLLDELTTHQGALAARTLEAGSLDGWLTEHDRFHAAWQQILEDVRQVGSADFSMYAMTCRKLTDLCRALG